MKKFFKALAVFMAAVMLATSMPATTVKAVDTSDLEEKKEDAEKKRDEVKKLIEELEADKASLEKAVKALDGQITEISEFIEELSNEIASLEEQIEIKAAELVVAKDNEAKQYSAMQKRIQFLYENGRMDYLGAVLSASSMSSILNRSEYVTQISAYDYNMLMNLIAVRRKIADDELKLKTDKDAAEELKVQNEEMQASLEATQEQKKKQITKYNESIAEQAAIEKKYEEEVEKYDEEIKAAEEAARNDDGTIYYTGGKLNWPCPASHRITSKFGPRNTGIPGASTYHKGIDIGVPVGNSVVAAEAGTVIAVSYNYARGYYVMVNHGGGLTTLYQHCNKITVSVGQKVERGEQVALSGNTGIGSGPHLHFEVRENGTPVDPLNYLQ